MSEIGWPGLAPKFLPSAWGLRFEPGLEPSPRLDSSNCSPPPFLSGKRGNDKAQKARRLLRWQRRRKLLGFPSLLRRGEICGRRVFSGGEGRDPRPRWMAQAQGRRHQARTQSFERFFSGFPGFTARRRRPSTDVGANASRLARPKRSSTCWSKPPAGANRRDGHPAMGSAEKMAHRLQGTRETEGCRYA